VKAAFATAALALAIVAAPASAAFPGTNGPIAFERSGAAIASINADGTGPTTDLAAVVPTDRDPAWSHDGRLLAFTSTRDGNEEIYLLDVETRAQTRLTFDSARDHDPAFSPDGSRIAFASERDGNSELYVMAATGGPPTRLTSNPAKDQQPAWSARDAIAFASDRAGDLDLWAVDPAGGGLRRLTVDAGIDADPSWSPDGAELAYTHDDEGDLGVFAIDAGGANRRAIVDSPTTWEHFPAWSPDGTRIAFARYFTYDFVFVTLADGSGGEPGLVAPGTDPSWAPLQPATAPPERGETFAITPVSDGVLVAPGTAEDPAEIRTLQTRLRTPSEVPVHTSIDASRGTVLIEAATTTPAGPNTIGQMRVTGGVFTIDQGDGAGAVPTLRLDVPRPTCTRRARARASRYNDGSFYRFRSRGRYRGVGGYGRGAGHGTRWAMHERCDGSIFKVTKGLVLVRDFRRNRTVRVRAGRCYLAAARPRRDARRPRRTCPPIRRPR
jgi:dipeptidyl aminopeptidase/acylaminoacyl peptidase